MIGLSYTARRGASALTFICAVLASNGAAAQPVKRLVPFSPAATPPLELRDGAGRLHRLADYRGKVVLVNFWATWCEPCRDEMPSIQQLDEHLGSGTGGDLVVLAVNYGESAARIDAFLKKLPLRFPILRDGFSEAWRAWNPGMLPATYLVGRDGRVRYRVLGEFDWSGAQAVATVRRLLAEKSN